MPALAGVYAAVGSRWTRGGHEPAVELKANVNKDLQGVATATSDKLFKNLQDFRRRGLDQSD